MFDINAAITNLQRIEKHAKRQILHVKAYIISKYIVLKNQAVICDKGSNF